MPESTPVPALGSTADTTPYVSVSWVSVGAATAAGLFLGLLFAFGIVAFREKKPLLLPELMILPVIAIVLSFAARKLIQNSEGTRTGILFGVDLVKSSWWVALVGGLGFSAYLFAIDYSVRRDAAHQAEQWVGFVLADDVNRAFLRTLEPGRRASLSPDNTAQLQAEFGPGYLAFEQADLVLLAKRNPGACTFSTGVVKDWLYQPGTTKCTFTGTVKCPEGSFPIEFELRGIEGGVKSEMAKSDLVGRQWAISFQPGQKYILQDKISRTAYGWRMAELERSAETAARGAGGFLDAAAVGPGMRAFLYQSQITPTPDPKLLERAIVASHARLWSFDLPMAFTITPDYSPYIQNQFIRHRDGSEPSAEMKELFLRTWMENGLLPPGRRIKDNEKTDVHSIVTITDIAIEVRVPCEIPLYGSGTAARGRLVMICTEPEVLAELRTLRAEASNEQGTTSPPDSFGKRPFRWRVARVESDLREVKVMPTGPGGPRGPGG
ncbi:MAG: hypothetical protein C0467_00885 [Planctomycetaceae bacterium]|nr:hypothetical protein [Planctomycetaceae bacterium]